MPTNNRPPRGSAGRKKATAVAAKPPRVLAMYTAPYEIVEIDTWKRSRRRGTDMKPNQEVWRSGQTEDDEVCRALRGTKFDGYLKKPTMYDVPVHPEGAVGGRHWDYGLSGGDGAGAPPAPPRDIPLPPVKEPVMHHPLIKSAAQQWESTYGRVGSAGALARDHRTGGSAHGSASSGALVPAPPRPPGGGDDDSGAAAPRPGATSAGRQRAAGGAPLAHEAPFDLGFLPQQVFEGKKGYPSATPNVYGRPLLTGTRSARKPISPRSPHAHPKKALTARLKNGSSNNSNDIKRILPPPPYPLTQTVPPKPQVIDTIE